jgi:iron complex transport system ATP-binding protein
VSLVAMNLAHRVGTGPDARWLFRDLDLEARPGRLTVIVGPNGAGKSTLLRALAGLLRPARGTVTLDDGPLLDRPARERARRLAYLPQTTPLIHDLTVRELVALGRAPHLPRIGAPSAADVLAVDNAIRRVGLHALGERRVFTLSGGEYQRVMIARMLASEGPTLLLDEPTASLDVGHALEVLELLRDLARSDRAVVTVLHDLNLARRYADHVVCLAGDRAGTVHAGARDKILAPDVLEPIFGVRVEPHGPVLAFFPTEDPPSTGA